MHIYTFMRYFEHKNFTLIYMSRKKKILKINKFFKY